MWLIPTSKQWEAWSLPSKLTAISAYITILGLLWAGVQYIRSATLPGAVAREAPRLETALQLRIDGFKIRVSNPSNVAAHQIVGTLRTWQDGAPGPDIMEDYQIRDLVPADDYTFHVDLFRPGSAFLAERAARPTSGYFVVRSIDSNRPQAWAFYVPGEHDMFNPIFVATGNWPIIEFDYATRAPEGSPCIDYPVGVCAKFSLHNSHLWTSSKGSIWK